MSARRRKTRRSSRRCRPTFNLARRDAPDRGAFMLVRLIGGLFVVATILELGLYWAKCAFAKPPVPVETIPCVLKLIPAAIGLLVLIKAKALDRKSTRLNS